MLCGMDVDAFWGGVLSAARELGPVEVRISGTAAKPALWLHDHELARWQAPGVIDVRVTAAGWEQLRTSFDGDPAVAPDPSSPDWVVLRGGASDVERLRPIVAAAVRHTPA